MTQSDACTLQFLRSGPELIACHLLICLSWFARWPALLLFVLLMKLTLSGLELLSLLGAANTTVEAAEGDALLLVNNVAKVSVSLLELQAVDGGSGLAGVLEVNTEVLAARLGGLLHEVGVIESVSDLCELKDANG